MGHNPGFPPRKLRLWPMRCENTKSKSYNFLVLAQEQGIELVYTDRILFSFPYRQYCVKQTSVTNSVLSVRLKWIRGGIIWRKEGKEKDEKSKIEIYDSVQYL